MSLSLDLKYTHLVATRFEKFARKGDYLFNVRCPICGDSKKNKAKMRGFIYKKGNDLFYKCHNCAAGLSLGNLIKQIAPDLHKEYVLERYKTGEDGVANRSNSAISVPVPRFGKVSDVLQYDNLERCDRLPSGHFCLDYLESRKIPKEFYSKLYFTANYKAFCDEMNPNHGKTITADERLVIPYFNEYNVLTATSGRALRNADYKLRYVVVRANNDNEDKLLYGMDRINTNETVQFVEGQFDSMFLHNTLASCDSSLTLTASKIPAINKVLIFDNEPRNKEIVKLMADAIKLGHNVVIWPDKIEAKDINEMVQSGLSPDEIQSIISSNTFNGLEAQTKFVFWKKV
jgi:hypothetical protein